MDWNQIEQNWDQVKYKARDQWGKLSSDELLEISGDRDRLEKKLMERYRYSEDTAKQQVDNWYAKAQSWPDTKEPRWAGY
jgi:uncharacterized protein YjbJ (UPF0337 family)